MLNETEKEKAPDSVKLLEPKGIKSDEKLYFSIGVTPLDCTGCGNCAQVCPAPGKALVMKSQDSQHEQIEAWNYYAEKVTTKIL
ncbi:ferredoxin [Clostridium saccharobutylicum]|nr:ferredoxin [Clostridium saccharobutylicum]